MDWDHSPVLDCTSFFNSNAVFRQNSQFVWVTVTLLISLISRLIARSVRMVMTQPSTVTLAAPTH